jgi:hypothetical protein
MRCRSPITWAAAARLEVVFNSKEGVRVPPVLAETVPVHARVLAGRLALVCLPPRPDGKSAHEAVYSTEERKGGPDGRPFTLSLSLRLRHGAAPSRQQLDKALKAQWLDLLSALVKRGTFSYADAYELALSHGAAGAMRTPKQPAERERTRAPAPAQACEAADASKPKPKAAPGAEDGAELDRADELDAGDDLGAREAHDHDPT